MILHKIQYIIVPEVEDKDLVFVQEGDSALINNLKRRAEIPYLNWPSRYDRELLSK